LEDRGKRTNGMNIYRSQLRPVKIMKLLY
jgi:hypothetical protein